MRMVILGVLKLRPVRSLVIRLIALYQRRFQPRPHGIAPASLRKRLHDLAARSRALAECPVVYGRAWSAIEANVTTSPFLQTDEPPRSAFENGCWTHADREPKFVINNSTIYLCEECAEDHRERGLHLRPIFGFLFGFPILSSEDDGILDCRIIDGD